MKKKLRIALGLLILLVTAAVFIRYATTHPELLHELRDINPALLAVLVGLYIFWFLALVAILRISLRLYGKTMSRQENILLNAYSSLVNFFGPGQSGPAFRGIYLKRRVGLSVKSYIFATLLYYGFYAILSAFLLFVGSRTWWQTVLVMIVAGVGSLVIIRWYGQRSHIKNQPGINLVNVSWLFVATAAQMIAQVAIYYVELQSIDPGISFTQTLTYTGAANFALFVALTPGAIGIREAFLLFSQNMHHIGNTIIVAANVIDRAIYLLFLGLLFILVLSLHAKDKLRLTINNGSKTKKPDEQ